MPDPFGLANRHARPAHTAVRCTRRPVGVRLVIGMTGGAMRLVGVQRRHHERATPVVLAMSHQREMTRVHAQTRTTDVVDLEPIGDGATLELPRDPMDVRLSPISPTKTDHSVTVAVVRAEPQPTVVGPAALNASPQSDFDWRCRRPSVVFADRTQPPATYVTRTFRRIRMAVPACLRLSAPTHGGSP